MTLPLIGFAGMTHLGLVSATATAAKGFPTLGYDPDRALIARLQAGELPVREPGLDEQLTANGDRQRFTAEAADLAACALVYLAVDVPTDDQGRSELAGVRALIAQVVAALGRDALLVILCQVPPGFTRGLAGTVLPPERLYYQVETLVFGLALERALKPERYIIGCADPARPLPPAFAALLGASGCPVLPMRYESAELAKISINFCLVASVTVANTLAEVCETIGADWGEIAPALKLDRRIGAYSYLTPGLGLSGGNLERDLATVLEIGRARGTDVGVIEAWRANSSHRKDWLWRTLAATVLDVSAEAGPEARIAILGLAYKENTHSTKNSPSLRLLERLKARPVRLRVHDPVVPAAVVPFAEGAADALACAAGADVLVMATPWPEYRALRIADLARVMAGRVILDPYRLLDGAAAAAQGFTWHTLGMPPLPPSREPVPC